MEVYAFNTIRQGIVTVFFILVMCCLVFVALRGGFVCALVVFECVQIARDVVGVCVCCYVVCMHHLFSVHLVLDVHVRVHCSLRRIRAYAVVCCIRGGLFWRGSCARVSGYFCCFVCSGSPLLSYVV